KIIDTFCLFCRRSFLDSLLIVSSPMMMSPDDGSSRPFRRRISVDFPAPEYPMTPNISPLSICRLTSSTAVISAYFVLYFLFTFNISIIDHLPNQYKLKTYSLHNKFAVLFYTHTLIFKSIDLVT